MTRVMMLICTTSILWPLSFAQNGANGIRGDSAAIADAVAMVETMGGMDIWAQLKRMCPISIPTSLNGTKGDWS